MDEPSVVPLLVAALILGLQLLVGQERVVFEFEHVCFFRFNEEDSESTLLETAVAVVAVLVFLEAFLVQLVVLQLQEVLFLQVYLFEHIGVEVRLPLPLNFGGHNVGLIDLGDLEDILLRFPGVAGLRFVSLVISGLAGRAHLFVVQKHDRLLLGQLVYIGTTLVPPFRLPLVRFKQHSTLLHYPFV